LAEGKPATGAKTLESGRLGSLTVSGDQAPLGPPMKFTKDNIAQSEF